MIRRWSLREVLRLWGWCAMNGIGGLIKETPELACPCHYMRTQWKAGSLQPERGPSPKINHIGTVILNFQIPELWEINCIVYKQPSLWYFVKVTQTDQDKQPTNFMKECPPSYHLPLWQFPALCYIGWTHQAHFLCRIFAPTVLSAWFVLVSFLLSSFGPKSSFHSACSGSPYINGKPSLTTCKLQVTTFLFICNTYLLRHTF